MSRFYCAHASLTALLTLTALVGCSYPALNAPQASGASSPPSMSHRRIELHLEDGALTADAIDAAPEIRAWVDRASAAIAAYYGRFPVERAQMVVEREGGSGIRWARTYAQAGAHVRVGVGFDTSPADFASDWMLTHEFVHLALPQLADEHDWLQEGAATYVEPVARAEAGQLTAERVWAEFAMQMPQGLPARGDRGLDNSSTWGRTYWGGALFCLVTDVEIRKRTENRFGLRDALRAILADGGTLEHRWTVREALKIGDRATGVTVLTETYEAWRTQPVQVDLDDLWRQLGVERQGRRAVLRDDAPLADIRRAITAQVDN
jgi:hypothetical protein